MRIKQLAKARGSRCMELRVGTIDECVQTYLAERFLERLASIYNGFILLHLDHEPKRSNMHTVLSVLEFVCLVLLLLLPFFLVVAYLFIYLCRCSFSIVPAFIPFLPLLWVRFCLLLSRTMLYITMYKESLVFLVLYRTPTSFAVANGKSKRFIF